MKTKILILTLFILSVFKANAASDSYIPFGQYGFRCGTYTTESYQEYIGETVMYIPSHNQSSYRDKEFKRLNGEFNTPYIITNIKIKKSGYTYFKLTMYLKEKDGQGKVKFTESFTTSSKDKETPFIFIDKLNEDKRDIAGKLYPIDSKEPKFKITDYLLHNDKDKGYPSVCYEITNIESNEKTYVSNLHKDRLKWLGHIFTHEKVKANYEVIELKHDKLVVRNSISKQTKEIEDKNKYRSPESLCFANDIAGNYIAMLSNVEKPENPDIRYGETKKIDDKNITKYSYTDSHIEIIIFASSEQFNFSLKNISNSSLKIIWNEAVYVDYGGGTSKIMHAGVKYSEKNGDQPATIIIKGAKIDDIACPTVNVSYSDLLKQWVTASMLPTTKQKSDLAPIRLMLPIQIKDVVNEYVFEFEVDYVYNHPDRLNL